MVDVILTRNVIVAHLIYFFLLVEDLKATLRKIEHETADMKFLNNQYIHKIRSLEKENKAKTERIQQLQEKNLHAVVQTPGTAPNCVGYSLLSLC